MQIPRQQVIDLLQDRGDKERVPEAERSLPDPVDTDEHAAELAMLGIDVEDLVGGLGGTTGLGSRQTSDTDDT